MSEAGNMAFMIRVLADAKGKYDIKAKAGMMRKKTYVSFMGSNMKQDFVRMCYFSPYVLDAGETMICRMVTEDK